eukprot:14193347-Alexandrium_andersonii.AAC.1
MLGSSAVRSSECVRRRPMTSQTAWMRSRSAGCAGIRCAGARCRRRPRRSGRRAARSRPGGSAG